MLGYSRLYAVCIAISLVACTNSETRPTASHRVLRAPGALLHRPALCDRPGDDAVRDVVCRSVTPAITGLYDLQLQLGLQTELATQGVVYENHPILLGHSTSLSGHRVSPLNPRAFLVGADVVLAFQRGEQRAELAAQARDRSGFNLYLVTFTQPCNLAADGCKPADLYGERVEWDWTTVSFEDDEALKNTALDCRQCHQRGIDAPRLLMRELKSPWTHFFDAPDNGNDGLPGVRGSELARDFLTAHGDEPYAGIAVSDYPQIAPFALERMVGHDQPLVFDTELIQAERWPAHDGAYAAAPQPSPTWERAYQAFQRGEQLALPYEAERTTDPDKQLQLTAAYRRFRAGDTDQLPELAEIFPDDPHTRARIGLQTEPDATPIEALIQACGSCHNDVLDQTISRARFNIDLAELDVSELDSAVERIERASDEPGVMPPPEARQLDLAARERLISFLRTEARKDRSIPQLTRASRLGMASVRRDSAP